MLIPLAEHFHSLQGEGWWVGTAMHFLRLPGCSVGRKIKDDTKSFPGTAIPYPSPRVGSHDQRAWLCRTFDNAKFWCDTDFNRYAEIELDALLFETWESHLCITGGEPLIHNQVCEEIIRKCFARGIMTHIETSGTIAPTWDIADLLLEKSKGDLWITVSPKQNYLPALLHSADELKILVHPLLEDTFPWEILSHPKVFLSPINEVNFAGANTFGKSALARAQELLHAHPNWRLSVQLHKYLGVR